MKTFGDDFSTMTVGELIEVLKQHPLDMPVLATWESVITGFVPEKIEQRRPPADFCREEDACVCLLIDVDQYG